ncbi:MAG TPA: hypothetical protein PLL77_04650 [Pyrinomonadaceae bacterium]|nr:hypothetical protein [Pyrinomonadaceae bacterium]
MKILGIVLVLSFAVLTAGAQTARKVIFYNGDKNCGHKSRLIPAGDRISCSAIHTERGNVNVINHNDVTLSVAFLEEDDYILVAAKIANTGKEPLMFDSDLWGAAHFATKTGAYKGERPLVAETSIPSRDIVRGMTSGRKLDDSLDTFIAENQKTGEIRDVRLPDGSRVKRVVVVPDKAAQEEAQRRGEIRMASTTSEQRRIRNTALTAKSIMPNDSVKGVVYFRRVKKAEFVVFAFEVDNTTFVFQLPRKAN